MKKALALLLSMVLATGTLTGCGGSSSDSTSTSTSSSGTSSDGVITVEFWNSAEGAMATSLEYLVDEFNSTVGAEKGIYVESIFQGGDVVEKLKTLAQAKDFDSFPDVGQIYASGMSSILGWDALLYMDDLYDSGDYEITVAREDIAENFLRSYTYEGTLVGMPLNASTILMYYNLDAAAEAGLDTSKLPETIEELAVWTEALTVTSESGEVERYGLNLQIDRYEFVNLLMGIGEDGYNFIGDNEGGRSGMMTKLTIGEDGSLMKMLTEWEKVIATGGYKAVNDDERGEFANGLSAINSQSSAQLQTMITNTEGKFELGVGPYPRATEEDGTGVSVGGGSLCMFDSGTDAEKAAAFEFVQFMASAESQFYLFANNGYLPVNVNTTELEEYKAFVEAEPRAQVAVDQMNASHPYMQEPFDLIMSEMNTAVKDNMIDFANGTISKEECATNIVDGFNAKLTEYIRANG